MERDFTIAPHSTYHNDCFSALRKIFLGAGDIAVPAAARSSILRERIQLDPWAVGAVPSTASRSITCRNGIIAKTIDQAQHIIN